MIFQTSMIMFHVNLQGCCVARSDGIRGLHNLCAVLDLKDTTESSVSAELLSEEVSVWGLQPVDLCSLFAGVVGPGKLTEKWMHIPGYIRYTGITTRVMCRV